MKRVNCGVYQVRFNRLWDALCTSSARRAGEVSPEMVAGIIGSSIQTARRLLWTKIRELRFNARRNYV